MPETPIETPQNHHLSLCSWLKLDVINETPAQLPQRHFFAEESCQILWGQPHKIQEPTQATYMHGAGIRRRRDGAAEFPLVALAVAAAHNKA